MSFQVRNSLAVAASEGVDAPASLSKFGDLVTMPWIYKLAMAGRIYMGGYGLEETDTDGEGTLADITPTFALAAPASGLLIIPLYVRLQLTTEGGAAPDAYLTYVSTGSDTGIVISGTSITALNCLGGSSRGSQANFIHTVTSAAFTDAQNKVLWQSKDMPDDLLSVVGIDVDGGSVETPANAVSAITIPIYPNIPIILNKGSSLNFHATTGTSDSKWRPTFVWAEVESTILP